jgi:hypothetical protein
LQQVHGVFGKTLMLAGVARIIEICFVAKHFNSSSSESADDDSNSDHTLADAGISSRTPSEGGNPAVKAFRHLPPFVRNTLPP